MIDFSDSGSKPNHFAVIELIRRRTVVVPVNKLELVAGKQTDFLD